MSALNRSVQDAPPSIRPLVATAYDIVASDAFGNALAASERLGATVEQEGLGADVARIYLGGDPQHPMEQTTYAFAEDEECSTRCSGETAHTNLDARGAFTCLQAITVERAASDVLEKRACAVNTIAHEWTHAVRDAPTSNQSYFQDAAHGEAKFPLVSYAVGALAQCLYLRQAGVDIPDARLPECVNAVGTIAFYAETCEPGWADRFKPPASG